MDEGVTGSRLAGIPNTAASRAPARPANAKPTAVSASRNFSLLRAHRRVSPLTCADNEHEPGLNSLSKLGTTPGRMPCAVGLRWVWHQNLISAGTSCTSMSMQVRPLTISSAARFGSIPWAFRRRMRSACSCSSALTLPLVSSSNIRLSSA